MVSLRTFTEVFAVLGDVLSTVFISVWAAFLLPAGLIVAIVYGGWLYFAPLVAANILIAYKVNKARKAGRLEAYDDKKFNVYQRGLESYARDYARAHPQADPEKE